MFAHARKFSLIFLCLSYMHDIVFAEIAVSINKLPECENKTFAALCFIRKLYLDVELID